MTTYADVPTGGRMTSAWVATTADLAQSIMPRPKIVAEIVKLIFFRMCAPILREFGPLLGREARSPAASKASGSLPMFDHAVGVRVQLAGLPHGVRPL